MISVIIPTLNAADDIGPCLVALSPAVMEAALSDVVIADAGSSDGTEAIADATGATFITSKPGAQIADGATAARSDWLLFLTPQTVLSDDWLAAAQVHMDGGTGRAGWFRLTGGQVGFVSSLSTRWANLRARFGRPGESHGLLIHRSLYREASARDGSLAHSIGRAQLAPLAATARVIATSLPQQDRAGQARTI